MSLVMLIAQSLYFFLPAYFANMAPVIVKNVPFLKYPFDLGQKWGKDRLFGEHKTFRGLVFGVLFAVVICFLQSLLYQTDFGASISLADYSNWPVIGFLLGSGAILGDLAKSFFKRRLHINPGKPFVPFDQLDFVIGALLFVSLAVKVSLAVIVVLVLASFLLHILTNHIAFYAKIRNEKW